MFALFTPWTGLNCPFNLWSLKDALNGQFQFANAGIIDEYIEKSKANKELNDKKRLATSGANFARAFTVQFGTCKFPENFTGCQAEKVPFILDDLELECKGKDKYKCEMVKCCIIVHLK
ncbi:photosystem I reaction center subunit N, chloroplastic-like [Olea europaea var. sylvestris]|uniref:photosystem I reaction center subunit N, chloroplastic-like n=1 Tax=Olea europaea var. sylvestris TaxID=158386 RepID=UPI000C1CD196|nr:photosystem I reaction center subunit N, chloroplastic-like [Olea europaea var. sylvestris]